MVSSQCQSTRNVFPLAVIRLCTSVLIPLNRRVDVYAAKQLTLRYLEFMLAMFIVYCRYLNFATVRAEGAPSTSGAPCRGFDRAGAMVVYKAALEMAAVVFGFRIIGKLKAASAVMQ